MLLIKHGADVNVGQLHRIDLDNLSMACSRPSPNLANLVFKAGFRLPSTHYTDSSSFYKAYPEVVHKDPLSLSDLCRLRIRRMAKYRKINKKPMYKYISSLLLPKQLKEFLMFETGW